MKLEIRVERERATKLLTLDDLENMQSGSTKGMKHILACFLIDPATNDYYPVTVTDTDDVYTVVPSPVAAKKIGMLTLDKIQELTSEFAPSLDAALIPPPTGG
jgi:hypothetical protein